MNDAAGSAKDRMVAWRRARPRTPPLTRRVVRARGLAFATWSSPPVPGTTPLVAVNGGLIYGHDLLWPAFAPLAADRQVVLYDQRGRGETPAPPGHRAARIEHDALDLPALREALGVDRWDIAAHSWGGGIAMLAASADPDGVRRLVAIDAVGPTSRWLDGLHDRALAHLAERGAREAYEALHALDPLALHADDPALHATYSRTMYPAWFHDQEMLIFSPPLAHSPTGAAVAARLRREGYDWTDAIARIRARALFIHGTNDAIPVAEAHANAALVAGARVVTVDAAGHMPFFENPEPTFSAALAFLDAAD